MMFTTAPWWAYRPPGFGGASSGREARLRISWSREISLWHAGSRWSGSGAA